MLKKKKGLNIFLTFKLDPKSFNYFKSIKLDFVSQNQELIER
jgi:hypothetical protein